MRFSNKLKTEMSKYSLSSLHQYQKSLVVGDLHFHLLALDITKQMNNKSKSLYPNRFHNHFPIAKSPLLNKFKLLSS